MSNFATQQIRFGLAKESVRGTAETEPTTWMGIDKDSALDYKLNHLPDNSLRGVLSKYPPIAGQKIGSGSLKFPLRAQQFGEFLHMLIGDPTTTEQAVFTVTLNTNDKINFTEDGGVEKTATLTAGSYKMGTASSQAGTLCKEIKDQLESANGTSETYTVTYSYSTKKLTITKGSGVFVLLWSTGANAALSARTLLGFTAADTASAIAATSDSTTSQPAFLHSFVPAAVLQPDAYTFFMDRSLGVKKYNLGAVSEINLASTPDDMIRADVAVMFKTEADGSIGTPAYSESGVLTFQHVDFKIATVSNTQVKSWNVKLSNGLLPQRTMSGSQDVAEFQVIEHMASGAFVVYLENATERAKFLANTESAIQIVITGAVITGSTSYKLDLTFDGISYQAFPYSDVDGLLGAQVTWQANYNVTNSRIYKADLTNIKSAY